MKRMALILTIFLCTTICIAQRRPQDPTPEELAKIYAAVPKKATAKPLKPRRMLVLTYQSHEHGRYAGEKALEIMARQTGAYELEFVRSKEEMVDIVVPEVLKNYDAVCVNNSTGGEGNAKNGKTFVENISDYVAAGGGLVGIHSATDNRLGEVFGGFFCGHPWSENVGIMIDDPKHTLTKVFQGQGFMIHDEIYQFNRIYSRENLRILISLDMTKCIDKGQREDGDNAVAWVKQHGKGRVFYCSLGHRKEIFQNADLMQFYLDGIQFALGDIKADMTPSGPLDKPKIVRKSFKAENGMFEGYIVDWQYAGPYLSDHPFDEKFAPEVNSGNNVEWKQVSFSPQNRRPYVVDFEKIQSMMGDNRSVYLRTNVYSPESQKVTMVTGSDDGIKVWLNGKVVQAKNTSRGFNPDSDKVDVTLNKGWNEILAKVTQGGGGWAASMALKVKDKKLSGLKCRAELRSNRSKD